MPSRSGSLDAPPVGSVADVELAVQVVIAALLSVPAVIHAAVAEADFVAWSHEAALFVSVALLQGLLAMVVLVTLTRTVAWAIAAVGVGVAGFWLASRTTGVPFGPTPWVAEPVGAADAISTLFELAAAALAIAWVTGGLAARLQRSVQERSFLALLLALAVIAGGLGYMGVQDSLEGHAHHRSGSAQESAAMPIGPVT